MMMINDIHPNDILCNENLKMEYLNFLVRDSSCGWILGGQAFRLRLRFSCRVSNRHVRKCHSTVNNMLGFL